jgi:ribose/xylose/arabinose/galactoside ABC-type transport system permease subunit/ABC-type branched-subunit amino acid transport system ATPase component
VAGLLVLFFSLSNASFFTTGNALAIGQDTSAVAIAGMGTAVLLITGNVDLSIGSMYGLIGMIVAEVAVHVGSPVAAVAAGLFAGAALGAVNGTLVQRLQISPLIVTIALLAIYAGFGYVINSGFVFGFSSTFIDLGRGELASVPYPVIVAAIVVVAVSFVLSRTVTGLRLYAIGGDAVAAERAGVRVRRMTLAAYAFNGLLIGLIAVLTTAQLGNGAPNIGVNFEFSVLTAVILGGVAFEGGAGRPWGIVIGVLTIGILNAGLVFEGLQIWWQQIAQGAILLLALIADQLGAARRAHAATRSTSTSLQIDDVTEAESQPVVAGERSHEPRARPGKIAHVLEARAISKSFGPVSALESTSLTLRAGEITALVGDNGAGKSTLIKILSGVLQPDEGELLVDGRTAVFRDPAGARAAGVETVYQDLALCPNLSVTHNFMLGREPRRRWLRVLRVRDDAAAAIEARRRLGALRIKLPDTSILVGNLSGGQRQAVAVARVMAEHVRVVCLDEPTAALGVAQTAHVLEAVRALADKTTSVLLITHDVNAVMGTADRVVVMRHGQIAFDGPTADLSQYELLQLMAGLELTDSNTGLALEHVQ